MCKWCETQPFPIRSEKWCSLHDSSVFSEIAHQWDEKRNPWAPISAGGPRADQNTVVLFGRRGLKRQVLKQLLLLCQKHKAAPQWSWKWASQASNVCCAEVARLCEQLVISQPHKRSWQMLSVIDSFSNPLRGYPGQTKCKTDKGQTSGCLPCAAWSKGS